MTAAPALRSFVLGAVTGMRSQLGVAVLAWSEPASGRDTRALRLLRSGPGRGLTGVGAAVELVADKLPSTPSRLEPQGLAFRLLAGAGVGALAANSTDRRTLGVRARSGSPARRSERTRGRTTGSCCRRARTRRTCPGQWARTWSPPDSP
jgi:hypothetical protein